MACTLMNTYINVCTIKSILVNNTARVHTQRETSILVRFPMQTHHPRTGEVSLVTRSKTQELKRVSTLVKEVGDHRRRAGGRAEKIRLVQGGPQSGPGGVLSNTRPARSGGVQKRR